ncbi:response regulator [Rheinheimera riviphila]|uniref:histidine kinase n=1 Tax=Rheinheimera riviphila TaxID=1834037 RepID=A0A437QG64_9GAMM|nr:trifunctional serine/threonine-protein kinase/ATP-binding protein/hybrid sensor histidine kinase/response regulator [Rheinheimera riviphila]RVU33543.1 response regulator [Rheinheimera riviphila]
MLSLQNFTDVQEQPALSAYVRLYSASLQGQPLLIKQMDKNRPQPQFDLQELQPQLPAPVHSWSDNQDDYQSFPATALPEQLSQVLGNLAAANLGVQLQWMLQLTLLLESLHQRQLVLGDLRAGAVFRCANSRSLVLLDASQAAAISSVNSLKLHQHDDLNALRTIAPEATGRVNAPLDQRTDLYSLGVLFYAIVAGRYPFEQQQPIELVHAHIALTPPPLPLIPAPLNVLISTLLQKNSNQRYSQISGLRHDLELLLNQWQQQQQLELPELSLRLGDQQLHFSSQLYGRETQQAQLQALYQQVRQQQQNQLLLIEGYSGIGKTALIDQLYRHTLIERPHFCRGKFDQYQRNQLYSAWQQLLTDLSEQLLQEPAAQLQAWQQQLHQVLGSRISELQALIPSLQPLLGEPQTKAVPPGAESGFNASVDPSFDQLLLQFFRVMGQICSQSKRPLVLLLDDVQWADNSSLRLLQSLLTDDGVRGILLILSYRDNEMDEVHPLRHILQKLQQAGIEPERIALQSLDQPAVTAWLADTLRQPPTQLTGLSQLLIEKTSGNPFFLRQFLLMLQQKNLLVCDGKGRWSWDISAIARQNITDNLVELTAQRFATLSPGAHQLLKVAALLGETADLQVVAAVLQQSYPALQPVIGEVVHAGIMTAYSQQHGAQISSLRFVHDRLQQAAFALLQDDATALHRAIADDYLQGRSEAEQQQHLFSYIDHLNAAGASAVSHYGALAVARLNLAAARQAHAGNAWHEAAAYYQRAYQLSGGAVHTDDIPIKQLSFDSLLGMANCQYLTQQYDAADQSCLQLHQAADQPLPRMQVARLEILLLFARNNFAPAFELAQQVLQPVGVDISQLDDIPVRYLELEQLYDKTRISDLVQQPALTSAELLMAMEILNTLLTVAFLVSPLHYLAVSYALVSLSIQNGHCAASSKAYSTHAMNLSGAFGQYKEALDFADLAIVVNQQYQGKFAPELNFQRAATVLHWNAPLQNSLQALEQNIYLALGQGNLEYSVHSALFFSFYQSLSGTSLDEVAANLQKYRQFISEKKFAYNLEFIRLWQQYVLNLQTSDVAVHAGNPLLLCGEAFHEAEQLPLLEQTNNVTILFCYHSIKLMLAYLFNDDEAAIRHYQAALPLTGVAMSLYHQTEFYFFAALLATRLCQQQPEQQSQWQPLAEQYLQLLRQWTNRASANHQHKVALLEAELAAIAKQPLAWQAYDQALKLAQQSGFCQHHAIAAELTAGYWQRLGKADFANLHWQQALQQYQNWQAHRKVAQLQQLQPQLQAKPQNQLLDMASVLKAAETLSGQIDLSAFLQQMIDLIVENAGAQAGRLWLLDEQQQLQLKASAPASSASRAMSSQLLALVSRTLQPRLVNDLAGSGSLFQDLPQPLPAAVLCIPVIVSGQLCGLLYLEHFELSGAFTEDRINLLQLLANQTAILSENTRLYHQVVAANKNLEQKVWERTQELASAKIKAESATAAKSSFLARMSHEIRTPINAVIGLSRLANKTSLTLEQQDYLSKIQESGEVLLSLVNDILDFSKIEAGKLELEITRFSLDKVLQRAVNLNALKAHAKSLELICNVDPALPAMLMGDPLRIQQILVNLISNAVKFSDRGVIGIQVKLLQQQDNQLSLQLAISDHGIGITPEQQQGLFQSFSQADDSITRKYGGSGLGLAICKQLCELMGGKIWLESQYGHGTTFYCQLQVQSADIQQSTALLPLDISSLKALVVDDITLARTVLLSLLGEMGISADQTDNGYQAIEMVRQAKAAAQPYDFVLMDWRMPGIDGIETSRRIQQLDDAPHILMVSAYDREQARASLQDVKISQFIEKPVNQSILLDALYTMLEQDMPRRQSTDINDIPDLARYRILLVEDHAINRQVALGLLKDSQVQVDIAENGLLAIHRLQQQRYDLVLMDIQMPEMDGLTACQHIRQQLLLTDLPVIAMTAHAMASDIAKSKAAGMNDHLTKPIDPQQLYSTLLQYLPAEPQTRRPAPMVVTGPTLAEQQQWQQLSECSAIDAERALKNLGGKLSLYLKLIDDFQLEHQQQSSKLQSMFRHQQWQPLYLDIHSLKSTSAYVGAFEFSQLCQQFETTLSQQTASAEALQLLCDQLQLLMQQLSKVSPTAPQQIQFQHLTEALTTLLPLLQESDFAAEDLLPALLEVANNHRHALVVEQIAADIRQVEYEKAAGQTVQLLQQLLQ